MDEIKVVYDRECPICDYYCQRIDVDATVGELHRVDAREPSATLDAITEADLDIDEGMVVTVGDRMFYGSEAIHELAKRSSKQGVVNRIGYAVFRHRRLANALYPLLAACRNLLLKLLGRTRINNLKTENNENF